MENATMSNPRHVHLVGSMNLPSAETAMDLAASKLGDALLRLPDGEPGPRRGWIFYQRPMFTHHRQLEPVDHVGGTASIMSNRRVRPGVSAEDIEFPELGYAREAQTSYRWFTQARSGGRVPAHTRFQVSLPTPYGILFAALDRAAIPVVEPAYEAAMIREVRCHLRGDPPRRPRPAVGRLPGDDPLRRADAAHRSGTTPSIAPASAG